MGGDRRPLPKCQLEKEEKLPDPSLGSPRNIMHGKDIIKWQRGSEAEPSEHLARSKCISKCRPETAWRLSPPWEPTVVPVSSLSFLKLGG